MRGSMLARAAGCALAAFPVVGLAQAADIADLAPRSSFVVASIDNWPALKADFEKSGLVGLWKDKSVRDYLQAVMGGLGPAGGGFEEMKAELDALGIDIEDLPPFGTSAGVAWFFGPRQGVDGKPLEGPRAETTMHILTVATLDGGEGEDGRDLWEIVEEALDKGKERGDIELEPVDYAGADIFRVVTRYEIEEWDEDAWENWDPEAPDAEENMPEPQTIEVVDVTYVARASEHLIVTTNFDALRDTIDRLAGKDRGETIGDVDAFLAGRGVAPAGSHAYTVVIPSAMVDGLDLENFPLPIPGAGAIPSQEILRTLGLTEVRALSAALVSNSPDAVAEVRFAALMDSQRGLFSLITGQPLPASLPSFVGPDVATLGVFRVNFAGILPLAREVLAVVAAEQGDEAGFDIRAQFEQFAGLVEPVLNALGDEVIQVGSLSRPFGVDSKGGVVALAVRDENALRNSINQLGGFIGLLPRDFAGSQIWEAQFPPMSVGLTPSYLFVGEGKSVERAMLAASQPDAPKLADDPRFAPAKRALGEGGIAMGWTDFKSTLAYGAWRAENFERVMRAEAEQFGMPPEQLDEYVKFMVEQAPASMRTPPPVDALQRTLGDSVAVFRSTARGIEGRWMILKPAR